MKYSAIIIGSLISAAFAAPQAASSAASATITQAPSSVSVSLTPQQTCLNACKTGDVDCQAGCVGVAHPNSSQAEETTQCAMNCDQGDGSPAATEKYSQCVQACISSNFPTSQTLVANAGASNAAPNVASATGSAAAAASSGASKAASGTASSPATGTASGASASSSSTGAASANAVHFGAAGLAGLFAVFAL